MKRQGTALALAATLALAQIGEAAAQSSTTGGTNQSSTAGGTNQSSTGGTNQSSTTGGTNQSSTTGGTNQSSTGTFGYGSPEPSAAPIKAPTVTGNRPR